MIISTILERTKLSHDHIYNIRKNKMSHDHIYNIRKNKIVS